MEIKELHFREVVDIDDEITPKGYIYAKTGDIRTGKISTTIKYPCEDLIKYLIKNKFELIQDIRFIGDNRTIDNKTNFFDNKEHELADNRKTYSSGDGKIVINVNQVADYMCVLVITYLLTISESDKKIINHLLKNYIPEEYSSDDIELFTISMTETSFKLNEIDVKNVEVKEKYYNNEIDFEKLERIIESDKNGLIVFSGIPGSGKTSLIKHLAKQSEKIFCVIPVSLFEQLAMPSFTSFLISTLRDSVLILEDCESIISNREDAYNQVISTLLNFSDGLIGSSLNLKIILTYNTVNNIDKALIRKGRTLFMHKFNEIDHKTATEISKELGHNKKYSKNVALCEIFNVDEIGDIENKKNGIGFK